MIERDGLPLDHAGDDSAELLGRHDFKEFDLEY